MGAEKIVSFTEFQSNPELNTKFGGDYTSYLNSFAAKLSGAALFDFASQNGFSSVPGLNKVSLFFGRSKVGNTFAQQKLQEQNDKKQAEIEKKLEQIKDPKIRAQVEEELYSNNLSDAFFDMLIERYTKKKDEFEEVWTKYQLAKGEAADMKRTCEKLLQEYQNNENSSTKGKYVTAEKQYTDSKMWAEIYLSSARDVSHRAV